MPQLESIVDMNGIFRNFCLLAADAVCVGACWFSSVMVYHACGGEYAPSFYWRMWPVAPAFLGVNVLFRLYHGRFFYPSVPFSPVEEMRRLVGSAVFVHLGVIALLALLRQTTAGYSRFVIVTSGVLVAVSAQPLRDLARLLLKRFRVGQMPVVLVGSGRQVRRLANMLARSAHLGFSPIGYFGERGDDCESVPRLGALRDVVVGSRKRGVRILLTCEDVRTLRCQMPVLSEWFVHMVYLPVEAAFPVSGSRTVTLDGLSGVEMVNQDQMPMLRFEKWALDMALAALVFVATLPAMAVLAVLVKLTSAGPVFFRHERLGRHGKPIRIWKFRTMYADAQARLDRILAEDSDAAAEWAAHFKLKNDPRVTPLGRFLRKTSLDELPQLFNVLSGSMALVGPRPIVRNEVPYYGKSFGLFSSVKPGVTGLWQVSGRSDVDYARRVSLDVFYVLNWSPWLDVWVLAKTVSAVFFARGAR